ncbi:Na+/H+ antiporter NhaC family protein [Moritella sp. F3]|uniref:Na+/H+ antiporter NhaC family protein n=1 Tax=Moritella sp. F3 TaxID=2718882 RepID=UPI001A2B1B41|nr:Na+/H+ antiporter NhaC family protein [Moritella sp. F3]GIC78126.1 sodium/hydrogen exchanger [Moritella sp. F1]GIC83663.1 sodium/hydrogen exchanger [Moritella sp. F3]
MIFRLLMDMLVMDYLLPLSPSLLALFLAFTTRRVILSLFCAVLLGSFILHDYAPIESVIAVYKDGIFNQLKGSNAQIVIVITIISGFIYLLESSKAMTAFSQSITRYVSTPAKLKTGTWLSGIAIFFTDSGNSLILGPIYRPLYDKMKICREKLALIIDSTSSPVCVLIPVISWGVYSMGLMEKAYTNVGLEKDGLALFKEVWLFQLYPLLTLIGLFFIIVFGVNLGKMKQAQQDCEQGKSEYLAESDIAKNDTLNPLINMNAVQQYGAKTVALALSSLALCMAGLFFYFTRGASGSAEAKLVGSEIRTALAVSYSVASVITILALSHFGIRKMSASADSFFQGMGKIVSILCILLLAWTLSDILKELDTGAVIATMLQQLNFPIWLLASTIFIIGAFLSIATGSSWGTFALLIPIVAPIAYSLDASIILCFAAALSGGLFGDHCSPISDTTVLSSMSSGVNHINHVETQMPYAMTTAFFTFIGFILASISGSNLTVLIMASAMGCFYFLYSKSQQGKLTHENNLS